MSDYDRGYLDGLRDLLAAKPHSDEYTAGWADGEWSRISNTCSHRDVFAKHRYLFRIPTIGENITLASEWSFVLHEEHRNVEFAKRLGFSDWREYPTHGPPWGDPTLGPPREAKVALPKGTVLRIDRIYIRKGSEEFDSVTFFCNPSMRGPAAKTSLKGRFWAKLVEVNTIVAVRAPGRDEN